MPTFWHSKTNEFPYCWEGYSKLICRYVPLLFLFRCMTGHIQPALFSWGTADLQCHRPFALRLIRCTWSSHLIITTKLTGLTFPTQVYVSLCIQPLLTDGYHLISVFFTCMFRCRVLVNHLTQVCVNILNMSTCQFCVDNGVVSLQGVEVMSTTTVQFSHHISSVNKLANAFGSWKLCKTGTPFSWSAIIPCPQINLQ